MAGKLYIVALFVCCCAVVKCEEDGELNPRAVEEGRTFAHHAMKRLAILLPAFMFKLGIMFTMILVSMITSTKSLLVGTLLLALGVGHFIASKFSAVPSIPVAAPLAHVALPHAAALHVPHYPHAHLLDRNDNVQHSAVGSSVGVYPASYQQYAQNQAYSAWKQ